MHKCYNYTKIKKGEPNLEKLKNCLDKWGHYSYSVHAVDGSIHTRFDLNNFAKLKWATKEQIEAVLAYIMSQGIEIAEDAAYRAYSLSGDSDEIAFVILMNDYAGSDYFIKYENDNLLVEPYAQWTSP